MNGQKILDWHPDQTEKTQMSVPDILADNIVYLKHRRSLATPGFISICPDCGKRALKKLISAAAFRLKGSGWYETDFKSGKKKNIHDSGGEQKTETKPKSKPKFKPESKSRSEA